MSRVSTERVRERQHAVADMTERYRRMSDAGTLAKAVELLSFNMKKRRRKRLVTAADMANVLGVSTATIVRWENDPGRMTVEQLMAIMYLLDIDMSELRLPTR